MSWSVSKSKIYRNYQLHIRDNGIGYLCGYVLVPSIITDTFYESSTIEAHGGITFEELELIIEPKKYIIKYYEGRWIGFDCAHWDDAQSPEFVRSGHVPFSADSTFKDETYVFKECCGIIDQLIDKYKIIPHPITEKNNKPITVLELPL